MKQRVVIGIKQSIGLFRIGHRSRRLSTIVLLIQLPIVNKSYISCF